MTEKDRSSSELDYLAQYGSKGGECPACGKLAVYRSRRRGMLEKLRAKLKGEFPMRCIACKHRYFTWVDPRDRIVLKSAPRKKA